MTIDLFNLANADDGEKLELARIGLIDLSVSELLEIRARARADIERELESETNPRRRARLQASLKESSVWQKTRALAQAMLDRQQNGKLNHAQQTRRTNRTCPNFSKRRSRS
jgi:hypothetical protein